MFPSRRKRLNQQKCTQWTQCEPDYNCVSKGELNELQKMMVYKYIISSVFIKYMHYRLGQDFY